MEVVADGLRIVGQRLRQLPYPRLRPITQDIQYTYVTCFLTWIAR